METKKTGFFDLPARLAGAPAPLDEEFIETLAECEGFRVERIISQGQSCAPDQWYDQEADEWVILLQGEATLEWDDGRMSALRAGDSLTIPAHTRHRVHETSVDPPCFWLAVHARRN